MSKLLNSFFHKRIMRFILVGCCSTGIDFVIYMIISTKLTIALSKSISLITSSVFSYFINKLYTFNNTNKTNINCLVRFYIIFIANFCINLGVNYIIYYGTGYKLIAYIVATISGMTINYMGQKFFVFKKFS